MTDRIIDQPWWPITSGIENSQRIHQTMRHLQVLVSEPSKFRDLSTITKDGVDGGILTQIVLKPTPEEILTVLCGDEDIVRTFNSLELDPENILVVAKTGTYPQHGGSDASLVDLILTPSEPTVAKPGVSFTGSELKYVVSRDNLWFVSSYDTKLPYAPFGGVPEEDLIPGRGTLFIGAVNALCKNDGLFHDSMMSRIQSSAFRWAIRLFEARQTS